MFTFKHVVVFFILQNKITVYCFPTEDCSYPECLESTYCDKITDYDDENYGNIQSSQNNFKEVCLEQDQSWISCNDILYFIEDKAEILKIKENLVKSYYTKAEEVLKKYMKELKQVQEQFENRPEHMLHILHDLVSMRQKREPDVQEIAAHLQEFYILEENYNDVAEQSVIMLNQLDKYKNICKINCEDYDIENRFGHKIDPIIISAKSADKYCVRLKDLNDYIYEKLSHLQAQYDEDINQQLEIRDEMYAQNISELKINLKEAAVKQFGMTMYNILSLQDDYHHFFNKLEHVNISSEIYNIQENAAEIKLRLIGLKRDLEKYRQYCMKCNINQRVKRNLLDLRGSSLLYGGGVEDSDKPIKKRNDGESKVVDDLITAKIDEIKKTIKRNYTGMFEKLDEKLNDPNVIDSYVTQLHPIQNEIEDDIKTEQEALYGLSNLIPEASIDKMLALSKESKQMIQSLESAKQFIGQFIYY